MQRARERPLGIMPGMHIELLKHDAAPALDALGAATDEYPWPIDPAHLILWSQAEPTHARALMLKAEGVAGGGWTDARAADLCPHEHLLALALDLETYGNAFARLERDRAGGLRAIVRLPAWSMRRTRAGGYRSRMWDGLKELRQDYAADEVIHLRQASALPGWYAVPSWAAAAGVIELLQAITRYNVRFFANNAVPDHIITYTGAALSEAQKDTIRQFFQHEFRGLDNSRKTLFVALSEGQTLKIDRVAQDNDGRFVELYKIARETLPAAHGVPPRLLGIATPGALGGLSEAREQMHMFETFTLAPRRRMLERALAPALVAAGVRDTAIRPVDLTPPGADLAALPQLVAAGVMTPAEARAWIDLQKAQRDPQPVPARLLAELLLAMEG
ncbi:MAG: phage portal protein [Acetobacteraceae bacterium]|nr:phage portal protein [Acetobacteraceae bacterium]